ncbi:MAG: hypothetical protein ABIQ18_35385 [Umezawaea sp.]
MAIPCKTVSGRPAEASVRFDAETKRVMITMPAPATGVFDWFELDQLAAAIAEARKQFPGRPS